MGVATALGDLAEFIGKEKTKEKIIVAMAELLKEEASDVKEKVILSYSKVARVIGKDLFDSKFDTQISNLTNDGPWRLRKAVFELIIDLAILFDY